MRKPGIDENDVQMTDVLCDFCHREWTDREPMIEGHHGSCICGKCLTVACTEVLGSGNSTAPAQYKCPICLETSPDRKALGRADELAWRSPLHEDAVICKRCIELAVRTLHKDKAWDWTAPGGVLG